MQLASRFIFGSMRMNEYLYSNNYWVELFSYMYDNGILIHHISNEYESYNKYLNIYNEFKLLYPNKTIRHLVKMAEPHFDSRTFSSDNMEKKIKKYISDLECNRLWGIQWMWRGDLKDESSRLRQLNIDFEVFNFAMKGFKNLGLYENLYLFPYTTTFCDSVLELSDKYNMYIFNGLTIYRNLEEMEYDKYLNYFSDNIIIRPLNAGRLDPNINKKTAISYALNHKNITAGIISFSSKEKLQETLI